MPDSSKLEAVKAAILNSEGKMLILTKTKQEAGQNSQIDLPGGRVRKNESLKEALARECREELGAESIDVGEEVDHWSFRLTDTEILKGTTFRVSIPETEIHLSQEHLAHSWLSRKEIAVLDCNFTDSLLKCYDSVSKA